MQIWKITWNPKMYDYKKRIQDFIENGNDIMPQSKGTANMKSMPEEGDIAYVSCDRKLIMKVIIHSKFQNNYNICKHDPYYINNDATHITNEYNYLKIIKIYSQSIKFPGNQRTWVKIDSDPSDNDKQSGYGEAYEDLSNDDICCSNVTIKSNNPVIRNYKIKEKAVDDYIKINFSNFDWKDDRTITDGCSKQRPDKLLDLGYQVIIVEIDEDQHKYYDKICENKRMMEISRDLGHRDIIFIRFNPDGYTDENNNKICSCWENKDRQLQIKSQNEWNNRLKKLEEEINYWINNNSNMIIKVIKLYYDKRT